MKMLKWTLWAMLPLLALGCKNDEPAGENAGITFEERIFSMESSTCKTDSSRCARVTVTYPLAVKGDAAAISTINDSIMQYVRQSIALFAESADAIPAKLEEAAAAFIGEYEAYLQEQTEFFTPWEIETNGKVLYQSPEIICVEIANYSFAGGAHPNTYTVFLNFDAKTGNLIDPLSKITDRQKLLRLAEAEFRKVRELTPDANLNDEGFFWDSTFTLPANIAITDKGLYFVYNPYEVAPYALGPTDFVLSYDNLKGIWKN